MLKTHLWPPELPILSRITTELLFVSAISHVYVVRKGFVEISTTVFASLRHICHLLLNNLITVNLLIDNVIFAHPTEFSFIDKSSNRHEWFMAPGSWLKAPDSRLLAKENRLPREHPGLADPGAIFFSSMILEPRALKHEPWWARSHEPLAITNLVLGTPPKMGESCA